MVGFTVTVKIVGNMNTNINHQPEKFRSCSLLTCKAIKGITNKKRIKISAGPGILMVSSFGKLIEISCNPKNMSIW